MIKKVIMDCNGALDAIGHVCMNQQRTCTFAEATRISFPLFADAGMRRSFTASSKGYGIFDTGKDTALLVVAVSFSGKLSAGLEPGNWLGWEGVFTTSGGEDATGTLSIRS